MRRALAHSHTSGGYILSQAFISLSVGPPMLYRGYSFAMYLYVRALMPLAASGGSALFPLIFMGHVPKVFPMPGSNAKA